MELVLNFSFTRPESSFLSFNAGICTKRPSRPAFATTTPPPCPPLATRSSLLWGQPRRRLPGQLLRHCPLRRASGRARSSAALLRGRNSWPPLRLGGQRLPIRTGPPQRRSPAAGLFAVASLRRPSDYADCWSIVGLLRVPVAFDAVASEGRFLFAPASSALSRFCTSVAGD